MHPHLGLEQCNPRQWVPPTIHPLLTTQTFMVLGSVSKLGEFHCSSLFPPHTHRF